jgi:hypothetical protein
MPAPRSKVERGRRRLALYARRATDQAHPFPDFHPAKVGMLLEKSRSPNHGLGIGGTIGSLDGFDFVVRTNQVPSIDAHVGLSWFVNLRLF